MTLMQIFNAIQQGDIDITYFEALIIERERAGYVRGYQDSTIDEMRVREQFLSECS